jgi:glycosyltransferase involved in cell wall biosynthesis
MNHFLWGRIVRHNLKNCDKILVSTPDVLNRARRFREDAEYLPNPVNTKLFYPKPFLDHGGKKRVLVASGANWAVKGTDIAIKALADLRNDVEASIIAYGADLEKTVALSKELGLNLNLLPKVSHENLNEYYWNADVVLDQFRSGALGLISLEAIACGRPAIAYASSEYPEYNEFILRDLQSEEEVVQAIDNVSPQLWKEQYSFFAKHHDPAVIVPKVLSIYNELLS